LKAGVFLIKSYFIPEANIEKYILGHTFDVNKIKFKLYLIEKTWGESPCFLAYVMGINDNAQRQRFLIRCMLNIYTKNDSDKWEVTIEKYK